MALVAGSKSKQIELEQIGQRDLLLSVESKKQFTSVKRKYRRLNYFLALAELTMVKCHFSKTSLRSAISEPLIIWFSETRVIFHNYTCRIYIKAAPSKQNYNFVKCANDL